MSKASYLVKEEENSLIKISFLSYTVLTFTTPIQFNSQTRYIMIMSLWMKADEASLDVRFQGMCDDGISVCISSKYLK